MIANAYAAAEGHAQSSGLPQFDSSVFGSQIFWTVVSFLLLMFLLNRFVIPAINDILDNRSRKIQDDLDNAAKAKKEAEQLMIAYKGQLDSAREMAASTMEEARQDANRHREQAVLELNDELSKKKNAALEEIDRAKRRAMDEVRTAAVDVAMMATEKLIAKSVTKTEADAMVHEAWTRLDQNQASLH